MLFKSIRHFPTGRVVIVVASAIALAVVIISPFALQAIASIFNLNWIKLSNIGQAYGAVSALIAALALSGVAVSIFLQARESRHSRWTAGRDRHFELMRIAMEDPFYRQVFSLPNIPHDLARPTGYMPEDLARLTGYINMIFYYWSMLWEFGDVSERELRSYLADILTSKAGRAFWQINRNTRLDGGGSKREIDFNRIADMVYQESMTSSMDASLDKNHARPERLRDLRGIMAAIAIGVVCGALSDQLLSMKRRKAISRDAGPPAHRLRRV